MFPLQDAYARGEVFIGCKENSYTVQLGLPQSVQGNHWPYGITIVTPDRKFLFACETEEDQKDWVAAFQSVIDRPMLPQEYAGECAMFMLSSLFSCRLKKYDSFLFFIFCKSSLQWRRISSANREPESIFEDLPAQAEEQGKSCNQGERPKYTVGAFKKQTQPCFPPGHVLVTHASVIGSLSQPSPLCVFFVFGCENQNFVQLLWSDSWLALFVVGTEIMRHVHKLYVCD